MVLCKSERRTEEKIVVVGYQYCILDFLKRGDDSLISEYRLIKECEICKQGITRHQARHVWSCLMMKVITNIFETNFDILVDWKREKQSSGGFL